MDFAMNLPTSIVIFIQNCKKMYYAINSGRVYRSSNKYKSLQSIEAGLLYLYASANKQGSPTLLCLFVTVQVKGAK